MLHYLLRKLSFLSPRSESAIADLPTIKEIDPLKEPKHVYPRAILSCDDRAYEIFVLESDYNWFMIAARRLGDVGESVAVNIASLKCKQIGNTEKWSISKASLPKSYEGLNDADRYDVANAMLQYCVQVIEVEIGPEGYQTTHDDSAWARWREHCAEPRFQLEIAPHPR